MGDNSATKTGSLRCEKDTAPGGKTVDDACGKPVDIVDKSRGTAKIKALTAVKLWITL